VRTRPGGLTRTLDRQRQLGVGDPDLTGKNRTPCKKVNFDEKKPGKSIAKPVGGKGPVGGRGGGSRHPLGKGATERGGGEGEKRSGGAKISRSSKKKGRYHLLREIPQQGKRKNPFVN